MANYIQDFLYTELPEGLIPDVIQWFRVHGEKDRPAPGPAYLMMAALTDDGVGYLCIEDNGSYRWVNLVDDNIAHKIAELTTKLEKLKDVVTSEGLDIKALQERIEKIEKDVDDFKEEANDKFALKEEVNIEVDRLDKRIDDVIRDVDELKALEDRVTTLENTVNDLKKKLDEYPDMPKYDPEADYYVLVFDSETHLPAWCPDYFPPLQ